MSTHAIVALKLEDGNFGYNFITMVTLKELALIL